MAHRKAGGTARNLRDSQPKYLGTKLYDGEKAKPGSVIVRQRGTKILPGTNTLLGKDHTISSLVNGTVKFGTKRVKHFDGRNLVKKIVYVVPEGSAQPVAAKQKAATKKVVKKTAKLARRTGGKAVKKAVKKTAKK